ncbi:MAG TPA: BlaI/MecI/CopY family transcriptional regulator [Verrucomicrobiales bacterium]|nr:BlaI/MecI/CopY family transcriptional regulator [Verrucomicrobiales bacterium]
MTHPSSTLTPNEWKVMQIVWRLKTCAARDVYTVAGQEHGWAPTTVKTYLSLLVEKGHLTASRVGNSFLYKPKASLLKSLRHAADNLLEKTLSGTGGPLLAYMIGKSQLTAEEIEDLRRVLKETKPAPAATEERKS